MNSAGRSDGSMVRNWEVRSGQRCRELFKVMFWMPRPIETVHSRRVSHFAMRARANR